MAESVFIHLCMLSWVVHFTTWGIAYYENQRVPNPSTGAVYALNSHGTLFYIGKAVSTVNWVSFDVGFFSVFTGIALSMHERKK